MTNDNAEATRQPERGLTTAGPRQGHQYNDILASDNSRVHMGDVIHQTTIVSSETTTSAMQTVGRAAVTTIQTVGGGIIGGVAGAFSAAAYSRTQPACTPEDRYGRGSPVEHEEGKNSWQVLKRNATREDLLAELQEIWGSGRDFNITVSDYISRHN